MSYHLAKFSGYRHCRSADINFFHVSPVHIIKRPCDIESWVPAIASYHSAKFGDHRYCVSADIYIYIFNVSRYHIIKTSRDLLDPVFLAYVNLRKM